MRSDLAGLLRFAKISIKGGEVMKKVSCKILKTSPFIERRTRNRPVHNKYRRAGDILPANILKSHAINASSYEACSGRVRPSRNESASGQMLDRYA
jgi:hypothetical protein